MHYHLKPFVMKLVTITTILAILFFIGAKAQTQKIEIKGSTIKPIEGTELKNGQIMIKPGYEARLSEDKTTVTIYMLRDNRPTTTGHFSCVCFVVTGECFPQITPTSFSCASSNQKPCMVECEVVEQKTEGPDSKPSFQKPWKKVADRRLQP